MSTATVRAVCAKVAFMLKCARPRGKRGAGKKVCVYICLSVCLSVACMRAREEEEDGGGGGGG